MCCPCEVWFFKLASVCGRHGRICATHRQPIQAAAADNAQPVAQGAELAPHRPWVLSRRFPATSQPLSIAWQHTPCSGATVRDNSGPACTHSLPAAAAQQGLPVSRTAWLHRCAYPALTVDACSGASSCAYPTAAGSYVLQGALPAAAPKRWTPPRCAASPWRGEWM